MPKILNVNIVVPDNCDEEKIYNVIANITGQGYFVSNVTLQSNELRWVNGDGFIKLK